MRSVYVTFLAVIVFSVVLATSGYGERQTAVQVIKVPHSGIAPDAEVDGEGNIHLVYMSDDDIYYVTSEDGGQRFSEPLRVNSDAGTAQAGAYRGPDVAVAPDGRVHVVWYTNAFQRQLPSEAWGVHYAYRDPSDTSFVAARNLNHTPSDNYSVAVSHDQVAVFWTADALYVQMSDDGGGMFSEPAVIALADPCECCATRAYFSRTGDLYVSYREKSNNMRDMYLLKRRAGQQTFVSRALSQTPWQIELCPMSGSYLTGGYDQELVAAWETKGQIYYGRVDEAGALLTPGEIRVSEQGRYPVVLSASEGTTLVAWKQGTSLRWQTYDTKGHVLDEQVRVDGPSRHRPAGVVIEDGTFVLFP